jgi:hypothetical protein
VLLASQLHLIGMHRVASAIGLTVVIVHTFRNSSAFTPLEQAAPSYFAQSTGLGTENFDL